MERGVPFPLHNQMKTVNAIVEVLFNMSLQLEMAACFSPSTEYIKVAVVDATKIAVTLVNLLKD